MSFEHFLTNPGDYTAFNVAPTGTFTGPTDGTIASPTGFEPINGYFVNSEAHPGGSNNPPIGWITPREKTFFLGDGAGNPLAEIVVECRTRINAAPTSTEKHIWFLGDNHTPSVPTPPGAGFIGLAITTSGGALIIFGEDTDNQATIITDPLGVLDSQFHKFRVEYKQSVAGTFDTSDLIFTVDDGAPIPFIFSTGNTGFWDQSVDATLTIGGTNTTKSGDFSTGDVFISSDSTSIPSSNDPPTLVYNSVQQR